MEERARVEAQLVEEQKKLEDMKAKSMKGDYWFLDDNEFETQEILVERLAQQLEYDRNNPQNLQNRIDMIDRRLQKFGTTSGLLYNLDQLREIMTDAELKDLIKMSVNQQGSQFRNEQKETKTDKNDGINTAVSSQTNVSNNATQNNYVEKLNIHGDLYIAREGYSYGL